MDQQVRALSFVVALLFSINAAALQEVAASPPSRIVSMNLCTDQLAMLIAAPGQLYSVSHLASQKDSSVLASRAKQFVTNHGFAEEIFLMRPDLIIAGTFSTRATVNMLRRLGFRLVEFAPAQSFSDIRANIVRMGRLLSREQAATRLVSDFDRELAALAKAQRTKRLAALYYANSYTSGTSTLASEVVSRAGLENLGERLGLSGTVRLPLELLVTSEPHLVIRGRYYGSTRSRATEVLEHPAMNALVSRTPVSVLSDKYWVCGAPFTVEAVRRLVRAVSRSE